MNTYQRIVCKISHNRNKLSKEIACCNQDNQCCFNTCRSFDLTLGPILLVDTDSKHKHRHVPPTFIELLRSQDVRENSTVVFDCIIHAEPTPHVVWERDGVELCQGVSLSHPRSNHYLYRLTLHNVQISDTGSYGCRATTHFGEATSVADLRVFSYTHQQQQQQQQYPHGKYGSRPSSLRIQPKLIVDEEKNS